MESLKGRFKKVLHGLLLIIVSLAMSLVMFIF
jgi:hypothetical protein